MQLKRKIMNQTWENGKKNPTNFGPYFDLFGPNLPNIYIYIYIYIYILYIYINYKLYACIIYILYIHVFAWWQIICVTKGNIVWKLESSLSIERLVHYQSSIEDLDMELLAGQSALYHTPISATHTTCQFPGTPL